MGLIYIYARLFKSLLRSERSPVLVTLDLESLQM